MTTLFVLGCAMVVMMVMAGLAVASTPYGVLIAVTCEVLVFGESGVANSKRQLV